MNFVFLIRDHVEIVIAQLYILFSTANVQIFNKFIRVHHQHVKLRDYFHV